MPSRRTLLALVMLAAVSTACGSSATAPSPSHPLAASIGIENLTASVQPLLTTSPPGSPPGSSVPLVSSFSISPANVPASHVTFTITYTDDNGQAGTASVANVSIAVVE